VQTVYFRVHQLGLRIVQQSTQHPLQGRRFDDVDVCGSGSWFDRGRRDGPARDEERERAAGL
jgi:hypothetical protein